MTTGCVTATSNFNPAGAALAVAGPGGQGCRRTVSDRGHRSKGPGTGAVPRGLFGGELATGKTPLRFTVATDPHHRVAVALSKKTVASQ
ncbi:unnamed protein product [Gemmataceae bacterium]|nr:unnamed protein product [Gemmataceae bacterium]VTT99625.1 unnamed protein product [Gemmataceae bacterium]